MWLAFLIDEYCAYLSFNAQLLIVVMLSLEKLHVQILEKSSMHMAVCPHSLRSCEREAVV